MSVELGVEYLGLELHSPLVASASPLTADPEFAAELEAAGAGAIVLPSLFAEEIEAERLGLAAALEQGTHHYAEALDYFPDVPDIIDAGERYLDSLARVRKQVGIPLVASLNAGREGDWVRYARLLADAGADAIELNVYHLLADPQRSSALVEQADLEMIAAVREAIEVPLAVKLSSSYTALSSFAARCTVAGADGLVLFNRFYQPDLDLETFDLLPSLELSNPYESRQVLRWMGILRAQLRPGISLAATSGVHSGQEALKLVAAGASVVMMTSALLRHGPSYLGIVLAQMVDWLDERDYESVRQLCGSASAASIGDPSAYERANYMRTLRSWSWPPGLEPWAPSGRAVTFQQPRSVQVVDSGD
jgi:dihydroorotate dehydrogenase (fumarate)